jgi:Helix-turn-helix domain
MRSAPFEVGAARLIALRVLRHSPAQVRTADRSPGRRHSLSSKQRWRGDEWVERGRSCLWHIHVVKRLNPRRVKLHRSYSVEEAARLLRVHKNTVRTWIKTGLQPIDERRPTLILGRELARFLHERRQRSRKPCQPGQLYCLRCRAPKGPAGRVAEYVPMTAASGNLKGRCCDCGTVMWRRVSLRSLADVTGALDVAFPQAQRRIADSAFHSLSSDFDEVP